MNEQPAHSRWGGIAQTFHWAVMLLFAFEYLIAQVMEHKTLGLPAKTLVLLHKSVGIVVLAVVLVRIAWRFVSPAPAAVPGPEWQQAAARLTHLALYGVLLMLPLTGYVMTVAGGKEWLWFGQWPMPNLVGIDPALKMLARKSHFFFVDATLWLLALHLGAVIAHRIVDGTNILVRMLPARISATTHDR